MNNELDNLINTAQIELEKLELSTGTLSSYHFSSFKPIRNLYNEKYGNRFDCTSLSRLKELFLDQYNNGSISHRTLNWRYRGIEILVEIHTTGAYSWKTYNRSACIHLNTYFSKIISEFTDTLCCSDRRKKNYESIILRFLKLIEKADITDVSLITPDHLRNFIIEISSEKPKSMDDVMTALRIFLNFLMIGSIPLRHFGCSCSLQEQGATKSILV